MSDKPVPVEYISPAMMCLRCGVYLDDRECIYCLREDFTTTLVRARRAERVCGAALAHAEQAERRLMEVRAVVAAAAHYVAVAVSELGALETGDMLVDGASEELANSLTALSPATIAWAEGKAEPVGTGDFIGALLEENNHG